MITRYVGSDSLSLRDDGRTVEGLIVPYGQVTEITESDPTTGETVRYRESFQQGSLARQAQGIQRRGNGTYIRFLLDHDESFDTWIGALNMLDSREDGAWASFRLYESDDLKKVQSMLRESHTGLSVGFQDYRPPKVLDGVVTRVQVTLRHVAATPVPAYEGALITAMREADPQHETPELEAVKAYLASLKQHA